MCLTHTNAAPLPVFTVDRYKSKCGDINPFTQSSTDGQIHTNSGLFFLNIDRYKTGCTVLTLWSWN
jgi:hypothetical protein